MTAVGKNAMPDVTYVSLLCLGSRWRPHCHVPQVQLHCGPGRDGGDGTGREPNDRAIEADKHGAASHQAEVSTVRVQRNHRS
jgi:hypothetical protein